MPLLYTGLKIQVYSSIFRFVKIQLGILDNFSELLSVPQAINNGHSFKSKVQWDVPFFIRIPLRMMVFPNGGFGFFLPRSPQNFDPSYKFVKGADKKRTQVQIPIIFRGVQIKNGTSQPMTRQW